jgi:hypothetical protein
MSLGDLVEAATPLAVIPLYWRLFREAGRGGRGGAGARGTSDAGGADIALFIALAALWAQGSGMHVAANAIGHHARGLAGGHLPAAIHFYDEVLSHWIWHVAVVGLSALLMWRDGRAAALAAHAPSPDDGAPRSPLAAHIAAGVLHGFSFFVIVVEGGPAPLGVPFAAAAAVTGLARSRRAPASRPILAFFAVSYLVALVFFAAWGIRFGGLPQFSEVGIID